MSDSPFARAPRPFYPAFWNPAQAREADLSKDLSDYATGYCIGRGLPVKTVTAVTETDPAEKVCEGGYQVQEGGKLTVVVRW